MFAKKENKVYRVDEVTKNSYLASGFDIYSEEGVLLERSPSATVKYSEYEEVLKENAKLKAENAKLKAK
ncbi:MAG: hypothetical protein ACI4C1_08620 [Lachnospiraceae bacterium]